MREKVREIKENLLRLLFLLFYTILALCLFYGFFVLLPLAVIYTLGVPIYLLIHGLSWSYFWNQYGWWSLVALIVLWTMVIGTKKLRKFFIEMEAELAL